MRAIIISRSGGPEVLVIAERPKPQPQCDEILIAVRAFGLNRAELYFRSGAWGEAAEISGIECAGTVARDPAGALPTGQTVVALMGGMGRSRSGSYAEFVAVPRANVLPVETDLDWPDLAALPESYATAWTCLTGNLGLGASQTIVIRGATSALGQAALNIAADLGARVIATTRRPDRVERLRRLGAAHVLVGEAAMADRVRDIASRGADAVLDLIGNTTVPDSLAMACRGGRVCVGGFLGGCGPLAAFDPVFQMPGGVHLSAFASAFAFGSREFPLSQIPFQAIVDKVRADTYQAKPAHVFRFEEIVAAHRLMEAGEAGGKVVIRV